MFLFHMLYQIASGCLRIITQFALKSETFMFELNMNFQMISIVCTIITLRTTKFLCFYMFLFSFCFSFRFDFTCIFFKTGF